jgi:hypothetical protein
MDYAQANEKLGSRATKKVGNNTYLRALTPGVIALRLHDTDVLTFYVDGRVRFDSGGWKTVTTKSRFNEYAPNLRVYSERGQWYVYRIVDGRLDDSSAEPFFDGIEFDSDGRCLNPLPREQVIAQKKENQATKNAIKKYVALYTNERIRELIADAQTNGAGGDCWYCSMRTETGETLGEFSKDNEHLRSHIEEGYTMVSLAYNALKAKGYREPVVILTYSPASVRAAIGTYLRKRLLVSEQVVR